MQNIRKLVIGLILAALVSCSFLPQQAEAVLIETSRTFYGDHDGWCYWYGGNYVTVWDFWYGYEVYLLDWFEVGQEHFKSEFAETYSIMRGYVLIDTSLLPDDTTILNATLSLYLYADYSIDDEFNLTIQNGQPTYPHNPITWEDYDRDHYSGNGGSLNTTDMTVSQYNNISLTSSALSWISKTGYTKLCLRSSKDINCDDPEGSGQTGDHDEYVNIASYYQGEDYAPILYVYYEVEGCQYILHGAFDEGGIRDGAINCTFYKTGETSETFELDGVETKQVEQRPVSFHFDLGYNETRVYYIRSNSEDIYVFKPTEPYNTYYFSVVDFVGLTNAYLESLIHVNATYRVVERWSLDVILNDIPFTFSWAQIYRIRIVSDQGTHDFGDYVAEATANFQLVVSSDLFPATVTDIGDITITAARPTYEHIQVTYLDVANQTTQVIFVVYEEEETTALDTHTETNSPSSYTYNWYYAGQYQHYRVNVTITHDERGTLTFTYTLAGENQLTLENPWQLEWIGTLPFPANEILGIGLVLLVFSCFNQENAHVGMVVAVVTAMFLTWIAWLSIPWSWLAVTMAIAIVAGISMSRKRSEQTL